MLTTNQKMARSIEYLIEIENLFYNARPENELTEKEKTLGDEIHIDTQIILKSLKIKALENCVKEFENE